MRTIRLRTNAACPRYLRSPRCWLAVLTVMVVSAGVASDFSGASVDQAPQALNHAPAEIRPDVSKPGVLLTGLNPAAAKQFSRANGSAAGSQTDRGGSGRAHGRSAASGTRSDKTTGDGAIGGDSAGGTTPLDTMLAKPWGPTAVDNSLALGVKPSALAATCVVESGCRKVAGSGSITGAFQMAAPTYTEMIDKAIADNPDLASRVVPGLAGQSDPATQSIAAAEYLLHGAETLRNAGIADPTVLDVRAYYNFGPTNGAALAAADPKETLAAVMPTVSKRTFIKNGVKPGETVGQWRASLSAKIGNAAYQSVLGERDQIFNMLHAMVKFLYGLA